MRHSHSQQLGVACVCDVTRLPWTRLRGYTGHGYQTIDRNGKLDKGMRLDTGITFHLTHHAGVRSQDHGEGAWRLITSLLHARQLERQIDKAPATVVGRGEDVRSVSVSLADKPLACSFCGLGHGRSHAVSVSGNDVDATIGEIECNAQRTERPGCSALLPHGGELTMADTK